MSYSGIGFAEKEDYNSVYNLFNMCFPGEEVFTDWFFKNVYDERFTLLYKIDGYIASMLQMLPYKLLFCGKNYNATYIFGAATDPRFRKMGLMAKLLRASFEKTKEYGRAFSVLIPQEKWLFGFYEKFGYSGVFKASKKCFTNTASDSLNNGLTLSGISFEDIPDISDIYDLSIEKRTQVIRDKNSWHNIIKFFSALKAGMYLLKNENKPVAYALGLWKKEGEAVLQELIGLNENYKTALANIILNRENLKIIKALTIPDNGNNIDHACLRIVDLKAVQESITNIFPAKFRFFDPDCPWNSGDYGQSGETMELTPAMLCSFVFNSEKKRPYMNLLFN